MSVKEKEVKPLPSLYLHSLKALAWGTISPGTIWASDYIKSHVATNDYGKGLWQGIILPIAIYSLAHGLKNLFFAYSDAKNIRRK